MKISILTPSFNSEKYISKAIESVLSQSYKNWEHIIYDGASTDNTVAILESYDHIIWVSEKDKGQSDAMNKAFAKSTGDIVVYLNSDDYFLEGAFEAIITAFYQNPDADMIVGNLYLERGTDRSASQNITTDWEELAIIIGRFPSNPVSYFYKRRVQENIGDFPLDNHYTMDYWFLIRAFHLFEIVRIEQILGCFVFTGDNKTDVIADGFHIQKVVSLQFCKEYVPKKLLKTYFTLLLHYRNKSFVSKVLRKLFFVKEYYPSHYLMEKD